MLTNKHQDIILLRILSTSAKLCRWVLYLKYTSIFNNVNVFWTYTILIICHATLIDHIFLKAYTTSSNISPVSAGLATEEFKSIRMVYITVTKNTPKITKQARKSQRNGTKLFLFNITWRSFTLLEICEMVTTNSEFHLGYNITNRERSFLKMSGFLMNRLSMTLKPTSQWRRLITGGATINYPYDGCIFVNMKMAVTNQYFVISLGRLSNYGSTWMHCHTWQPQ